MKDAEHGISSLHVEVFSEFVACHSVFVTVVERNLFSQKIYPDTCDSDILTHMFMKIGTKKLVHEM